MPNPFRPICFQLTPHQAARLSFASALLMLVALLVSCGQYTATKPWQENQINGSRFYNPTMRWTMQIPPGWKLMPPETVAQFQRQGETMLEEAQGQDIDTERLKQLLNLQRGESNLFNSSAEPFPLSGDFVFATTVKRNKDLIWKGYQQYSFVVDSSATRQDTIDGVPFSTFDFTLKGPLGNAIMAQHVYLARRAGYLLIASLNFNDSIAEREMLDAFRASVFASLD